MGTDTTNRSSQKSITSNKTAAPLSVSVDSMEQLSSDLTQRLSRKIEEKLVELANTEFDAAIPHISAAASEFDVICRKWLTENRLTCYDNKMISEQDRGASDHFAQSTQVDETPEAEDEPDNPAHLVADMADRLIPQITAQQIQDFESLIHATQKNVPRSAVLRANFVAATNRICDTFNLRLQDKDQQLYRLKISGGSIALTGGGGHTKPRKRRGFKKTKVSVVSVPMTYRSGARAHKPDNHAFA